MIVETATDSFPKPQPKPLIALTMRYSEAKDLYLRRDYADAVFAAGGVPLHLPLIPDEALIAAALERIDGILLPGSNSDVDPFLYGEEPRQRLGEVQPLRDHTDLALIAAAEKKGIPVFGICYGMQIINVARGGSLFQDIEHEIPAALMHQQGVPRDRVSHSLEIVPDSFLARLNGTKAAERVNTHHHQAINRVGENLRVSARARDGVIEAIEDTRENRFFAAVQWHPELGWQQSEFSQNLFRAFVGAARFYQAKKTI